MNTEKNGLIIYLVPGEILLVRLEWAGGVKRCQANFYYYTGLSYGFTYCIGPGKTRWNIPIIHPTTDTLGFQCSVNPVANGAIRHGWIILPIEIRDKNLVFSNFRAFPCGGHRSCPPVPAPLPRRCFFPFIIISLYFSTLQVLDLLFASNKSILF
jgi:hypothetical protein